MLRTLSKYYGVFAALVIVWAISSGGCTVQQSVSGKNISFLYKSNTEAFSVDHKVLNTQSKSLIYLRFTGADLGKSMDDEGVQRMGYTLRYRLYTSYSSPEPIDSGNIVRKDLLYAKGILVDTIVLKNLEQRYYLVECTLKDLNSPRSKSLFIDVRRGDPMTEQNFVFASSASGMLFENYINKPDSILFQPPSNEGRFVAKFYDRDFPISRPPFTAVTPRPFDFTPDQLIETAKRRDGRIQLDMTKKGLYQLTDDPESKRGATLFFFGPHFPEAKTVMDLALPLRYITTNEEYGEIMQGDNIKRNVDQYWLSVAGDARRARELIGAFYGRVQYANRYFTSYMEGWKTDRGMCYVVYGPPDAVYRSTALETWIYGEEGRYNALKLTFTKVVNPFTSNDFRLNRSNALKSSWYRAVEFWRQGRVLTYQ